MRETAEHEKSQNRKVSDRNFSILIISKGVQMRQPLNTTKSIYGSLDPDVSCKYNMSYGFGFLPYALEPGSGPTSLVDSAALSSRPAARR